MVIYDFMFNGKSLSSMGGELTEDNEDIYGIMIEKESITHKVPFVDGELFIKSVIKPISFRVEMCFPDISSYYKIGNWLNVSEPTSFTFIPDFCGTGTLQCIVEEKPEVVLKENTDGGITAIVGAKFICYNPRG